MPIKKAALKRMRADKKIQERNSSKLNDLKTRIKRFRDLVSNKKSDDARALLPGIVSKLNRAAQKNIIHKNKASRTASRLKKALNRLG